MKKSLSQDGWKPKNGTKGPQVGMKIIPRIGMKITNTEVNTTRIKMSKGVTEKIGANRFRVIGIKGVFEVIIAREVRESGYKKVPEQPKTQRDLMEPHPN